MAWILILLPFLFSTKMTYPDSVPSFIMQWTLWPTLNPEVSFGRAFIWSWKTIDQYPHHPSLFFCRFFCFYVFTQPHSIPMALFQRSQLPALEISSETHIQWYHQKPGLCLSHIVIICTSLASENNSLAQTQGKGLSNNQQSPGCRWNWLLFSKLGKLW